MSELEVRALTYLLLDAKELVRLLEGHTSAPSVAEIRAITCSIEYQAAKYVTSRGKG